MERPIVKIYDMETDKIVEREMNDEEFSEHLENLQFIADREAEAEAKATARASALAKLAELGLTADEIASL
jgi:hypothetical protein